MDKNTIIGFLLIAIIFVSFTLFNRPSEEEALRQQRYNDSIALVKKQDFEYQRNLAALADSIANSRSNEGVTEEVEKIKNSRYGAFSVAAHATEEFVSLENENLLVKLSSKGGRIYSAQLKNYKTHDSLPLILFEGDESAMNFTFITNNNRIVNTEELYFAPQPVVKTDEAGTLSLTMRLNTTEDDSYVDFVYSLEQQGYMLGLKMIPHNMNSIIPVSTNSIEMTWASKIRQQEKGRKYEDRYTELFYSFAADGDVENLSNSKDDDARLTNKLKWIAFKDQFFSSILIADAAITSTNLSSKLEPVNSNYLKSYSAQMTLPFSVVGNEPLGFSMFLGPNQYKILSAIDNKDSEGAKLNLHKIIPLGWGIFGWVNRFFIIPMFNIFSTFIGSFGIIIFLMTIVVKLVIFPLTYKSYTSSAKMRVLKPQIDEINARIPADKPQERQKATMALYGQVGVNPMSGCLPILMQMPILIAMFSFFPSAIELRQESFLWAKDLSTYDAILTWDFNIPIISKHFGNHLSLFCLLMTATTIIFNKLNMANTMATGGDQMGMMKWMTNLMPIMFMFMFNNYASGLTYYYFLSTLISIGQTYAIRATVDDKKILAQLHEKSKQRKNNPKKKSGFMERLEKMQREQEKNRRK